LDFLLALCLAILVYDLFLFGYLALDWLLIWFGYLDFDCLVICLTYAVID